jgi:hypothetical protein
LSLTQASEDALLAGETSLQPVNELGVDASTRPCGRVVELLSKMHRHPEQEAIDLPCHLAGAILNDLRSDIKRDSLNIIANIGHGDIRGDIQTPPRPTDCVNVQAPRMRETAFRRPLSV